MNIRRVYNTDVLMLSMYMLKTCGVPVHDHTPDAPRYNIVDGNVSIHDFDGDELMSVDDKTQTITLREGKYLHRRADVLRGLEMYCEDHPEKHPTLHITRQEPKS